MTTNPLPIHGTRVVPSPPGGVDLIKFSGVVPPQPISLYEDSDFSRYIHGQQVPRPFRLIQNEIP